MSETTLKMWPELQNHISNSVYRDIYRHLDLYVAQCPICLYTRIINFHYKANYSYICNGRIIDIKKRGKPYKTVYSSGHKHKKIKMNYFRVNCEI